MSYKMWASWNINICTEWASDTALAEAEKEIQEFIEWLTSFEYFELTSDIINWDKTYRLRSVNNK